jgi:integrase
MKIKLTMESVAKLVLPEGKSDFTYWCEEQDSFGVRLRRVAGGKVAKTWIGQCKRGGKTHRRKFGSAAGTSPSEPRKAVKKWLARIDLGEDPQAERRKRREADKYTMRALVPSYLAERKPELAYKTFIETERYLSDPKYWGPIHKKPLGEIALRDVAACITTMKAEFGNAAAANARTTLSAFMVAMMRAGIADRNPVIGSARPKLESRSRVLSPDELRKVWLACGGDHYGRIVRLLIATACRRDEIGAMKFSELDFERGTFTIPPERAKTPSSARTIPLLPMLREIIDGVPRTRDYLFGSRAEGFVAWSAAKKELNDRVGFSDFVIHDLRRSASTLMNDELEIEPHIVELLLGHEFRSGTHGTYNKAKYRRAIAAAYAVWHDYLGSLISGSERKVIPLSTA